MHLPWLYMQHKSHASLQATRISQEKTLVPVRWSVITFSFLFFFSRPFILHTLWCMYIAATQKRSDEDGGPVTCGRGLSTSYVHSPATWNRIQVTSLHFLLHKNDLFFFFPPPCPHLSFPPEAKESTIITCSVICRRPSSEYRPPSSYYSLGHFILSLYSSCVSTIFHDYTLMSVHFSTWISGEYWLVRKWYRKMKRKWQAVLKRPTWKQ